VPAACLLVLASACRAIVRSADVWRRCRCRQQMRDREARFMDSGTDMRSFSGYHRFCTYEVRIRCTVLLSVLTLVASGCGGGTTTAPSGITAASGITPPSIRGNLTMISMGVSDAGQRALGDWQYTVTVHLRETGGVDTTVTNIQVEARLGSNTLATESVIPMLSVSANSSSDAALVFAADTHVGDLSALTVGMTVQFTDAKGNIGSVSNSFTCFGCWD
jgi:hypothetical protein